MDFEGLIKHIKNMLFGKKTTADVMKTFTKMKKELLEVKDNSIEEQDKLTSEINELIKERNRWWDEAAKANEAYNTLNGLFSD